MDIWPTENEFQSGKEAILAGLEEAKNTEIHQLTGAAERILGILSDVKGHPTIEALHITIGLCVVAQRIQEKRAIAKKELEGAGVDPRVIKALLEDKVWRWFAKEATSFLWEKRLVNILTFLTI